MNRLFNPIVLAIILIAGSCNYASPDRSFAPMEIAGADDKSGESETANQPADEQINISPESRKLIKTGNVSFKTKSLDETRKRIEQAVAESKAYISKENESRYEGQVEHSLVIRVPSENFDKLLEVISKGVDRFDSKNVEVLDVTEEFVDIESRLKTKKELEKRYREMLAKADAVDEMLSIEKQIGELQEDSESIEGRLKYLQNQVSYSTLSVRYYETFTVGTEFGEKFKSGFANGWENLIWFFVGLVNMWPFIVIFLVLAWLILRVRRKRQK